MARRGASGALTAEDMAILRELGVVGRVSCPFCFRKHAQPVDAAGHCSLEHAERATPPPEVAEALEKNAARSAAAKAQNAKRHGRTP